LIQKARVRRSDLDSVFWINVVVGTGLMLFVTAIAFLASEIFRTPEIRPLLWVMAWAFIIEELSEIHHTIANRLLLYHIEVCCQMVELITRIAASIAFAWNGFGVWSLVWGMMAGRLAGFVLIWYWVPFVPRLRYTHDFFRRNWRA